MEADPGEPKKQKIWSGGDVYDRLCHYLEFQSASSLYGVRPGRGIAFT